MTNYTIGIETIFQIKAESKNEAIRRAHDKLQEEPIKSEELEVLEEVAE